MTKSTTSLKNFGLDDLQKVVFIDFNLFMFQSVFLARTTGIHPPWACVRSIFANLKRLKLSKTDLVIIAVDSEHQNWRKKIDSNYKSNRRATREKFNIDWESIFAEFSKLVENLKVSTPFHVIKIEGLEADDIISVGVRYFKDCDCIIVSTDSDYDQLTKYPNVKVLSPKSKKFKIVKSPELSVALKIRREKTDNLISPILNQADFEKRNKLVNLSVLPDEVELAARNALMEIPKEKSYDLNRFLFIKMADEIENIYEPLPGQKTITYADSFKHKHKKIELEFNKLF